jgi:hypothetical protein
LSVFVGWYSGCIPLCILDMRATEIPPYVALD